MIESREVEFFENMLCDNNSQASTSLKENLLYENNSQASTSKVDSQEENSQKDVNQPFEPRRSQRLKNHKSLVVDDIDSQRR